MYTPVAPFMFWRPNLVLFQRKKDVRQMRAELSAIENSVSADAHYYTESRPKARTSCTAQGAEGNWAQHIGVTDSGASRVAQW